MAYESLILANPRRRKASRKRRASPRRRRHVRRNEVAALGMLNPRRRKYAVYGRRVRHNPVYAHRRRFGHRFSLGGREMWLQIGVGTAGFILPGVILKYIPVSFVRSGWGNILATGAVAFIPLMVWRHSAYARAWAVGGGILMLTKILSTTGILAKISGIDDVGQDEIELEGVGGYKYQIGDESPLSSTSV